MGMQFSPMYQPVSTKTIKADGDLNVSPYDVIAYDGNFDTVEADEFVGGVGNFTSLTPVSMERLTLDYTSLAVSTPQSIEVRRKGFSFTHSGNLSSSTPINMPYTYEKPIYDGLIMLGTEHSEIETINITISMNAAGVTYGSSAVFYNNGEQIGRIDIARGSTAGSITVALPYSDNYNFSYAYGASGEAAYNPVFTLSDMVYYIVPYGQ